MISKEVLSKIGEEYVANCPGDGPVSVVYSPPTSSSRPLAPGTPLVEHSTNPLHYATNDLTEQVHLALSSASRTSAMPGVIPLNSTNSSTLPVEALCPLGNSNPNENFPIVDMSITNIRKHSSVPTGKLKMESWMHSLDSHNGKHTDFPVAFATQPPNSSSSHRFTFIVDEDSVVEDRHCTPQPGTLYPDSNNFSMSTALNDHGSSNVPSQYDNRSGIIIGTSKDVDNSDRMPFIVRTSRENATRLTSSRASGVAFAQPHESVDSIEMPRSPRSAQLRMAEKQRHHRCELDKNEDNIRVQEAIYSSLRPGPASPARRAMSDNSNDINMIINMYSRDDHHEKETDQYSAVLQEQLTYLDQP